MAFFGIFYIFYFSGNLFNPDKNNKKQNNKKLTKETVESFMNELFVLDQDKNKQTIQQYAHEHNITIIWHDTTYSWINLENKEVAFLNDFWWSPESVVWSDFLLLLEGQTVNLPCPKNQFTSDLLTDKSKNLAIFATSKVPIKYVGKSNLQDNRETNMMASRWQMFSFLHEVEWPRVIKPCPRCFADLVLSIANPEELES